LLLTAQFMDRHWRVDLSHAHDLSLAIDPQGEHPRFFTTDHASARPLQAGSFIGSIACGGPVNAEILEIIPHCQGTHTESVAHVTAGSASAYATAGGGDHGQQPATANQSLLSAVLISVPGTAVDATGEHYRLGALNNEPLLTCADLQRDVRLQAALEQADAVIIRSRPNPLSKRSRNYSELPWYPVLSAQAMDYLAALRLRHLLIDTPSLDRADDGGRVVNHKTWWGVQADGQIAHPQRLLTEMIYAHDDIADGLYLLDMQIAPLVSDAVPSRPVIFPLLPQTP